MTAKYAALVSTVGAAHSEVSEEHAQTHGG